MQNLDKFKILSYLYYFFPISLAIGNSAVNINIFIIIMLSLIVFQNRLLLFEKNLLNLSLISFFIIIALSSFLNFFNFKNFSFFDSEAKSNFVKSIFFFRFLFIYIILEKLILLNKFEIKYFYISSALISLFLCIDLYYQSFYSVSLSGYKTDLSFNRLSGFFGDEYIAGGYLQRFSLFLIFLLSIFKIKNINFKLFYIFFFLNFVLIAIILTNNRMPLILFVTSFFFLSFCFKKLKKISIFILIIFTIIFSSFLKYNERTSNFFKSFLIQANQISMIIFNYKKLDSKKIEIQSDYAMLYNSSLDLIKKNKFYGSGIKSFRKNCFDNLKSLPQFRSCNNHPHNYYFEILISFGYLGLFFFILIVYSVARNFFENLNNCKYDIDQKEIIFIPLILFFIEIFPIRSTGGLFSTTNAIYFFIILSIVNNINKKKLKFKK